MKTSRAKATFPLFALVLLLNLAVFSQDDLKPWERLGLSLTEWKLIQDNHLPMPKVEELLKVGIDIGEYFTKPWERLEMAEENWIAKRRSGLTSNEIEQEKRVADPHFLKTVQPAENSFQEYDASKENAELLTGFLAPGYLQCRDERKVRGRIMIGVAAGSIAGCAALTVVKKQFIPLPLIVILIPDMIWSLADQKKHAAAAKP
jgi:hypothetical protein